MFALPIIHKREFFLLFVGVFLAAGAGLSGCSSVGFYMHTAKGHLEVLRKREAVDDVILDVDTDDKIRTRLTRSKVMRQFAVDHLMLPDNDSYKTYVDLGRPYIVWSVTAAPEFSLEPYKSCYLIVGCMSYRGYHDKKKATEFARELEDDGLDVSIRGVAAYSTLGWFDDPLLNTMMHWSDTQLARLIFHELAHQVVYIKNDTAFNEAFAVSVERQGVRLWLDHHGTADEKEQYSAQLSRHEEFVLYVLAFREELEALYASALPEAEMRQEKLWAYARFKKDFLLIRSRWGEYAGFDKWFDDVNNAKIALFSTYREKVAGFESLFASVNYDFSRYFILMDQISQYEQSQREACLGNARGCVENIENTP